MRIDRWRRLRLVSKSVMSTDDEVAPSMTRRTGGHVLAIGLAVIVVACLLLFAAIQARSDKAIHSSGLNQKEITQLREFLQDRNLERESQQRDIQRQLDEQARILCLAIADFKSRAENPKTIATLDQAMASLRCAEVIKSAGPPDTRTRTALPTTQPTGVPQAVGPNRLVTVTRTRTETRTKTATKTRTVTVTSRPFPTTPIDKPLCDIAPVLCA